MFFNPIDNSKNRYLSIENLDLNIASSLNGVFWKSLGIGSFAVEAHMNGYEKLLKQSIHVCEEILTPIFADSIKCHQTALGHFEREEYKEAAALMEKVNSMSAKLIKTYSNINTSFSAFLKDISEALVSLEENRSQISAKKECLLVQKLKNEESIASLEQILKSGIDSLDDAIKLLWKVNSVLVKTSSFWYKATLDSQHVLYDPLLSDAEILQFMDDKETTKAVEEFDTLVEAVFNAPVLPPKEQISKKMTTGSILTPKPIMIITIKKIGETNEIHESSLSWSALAKANDQMASLMKSAMDGLAIHRLDIALNKQDTLMSALMQIS